MPAFIAFVLVLAGLVQADLLACKDQFKMTESVDIKSTAILCNNIEENSEVTLYIVEEKDALVLNVIQTEEILNSQFSCVGVWLEPLVGEYDVFVDCIDNENYDPLEPFDSFTVIAVKGSVSVSFGEKNPVEHSWMYDPEDPRFSNEMMQLKLTGSGEDVQLGNIVLSSFGTGNDAEIERIEIYLDENNNGKPDENEEIIGESEGYTEDNGRAEISLYYTLEKNTQVNILIVYEMRETTPEGEYVLTVNSVSGTGADSVETVDFSGLPLNSAKKTVLPEKTCLGELFLVLEPNPVGSGKTVTARMFGLSGCQGKEVTVRLNPCGSSLEEEICSCTVGESGEECQCDFVSYRSLTYHACMDKNQDGDMVDFWEYAFEDLIIQEPEPEEEIEEEGIAEEINVSEEIIEEEGATITGGVIEGLKERFSGMSSFFILLEITLLLILLVMILILFKLRPGAGRAETVESEE